MKKQKYLINKPHSLTLGVVCLNCNNYPDFDCEMQCQICVRKLSELSMWLE